MPFGDEKVTQFSGFPSTSMSYLKAGRSTQLLITEHQSANYKLCFLSEERLFSSNVELNKTILAAFITRLVRHPGKQN